MILLGCTILNCILIYAYFHDMEILSHQEPYSSMTLSVTSSVLLYEENHDSIPLSYFCNNRIIKKRKEKRKYFLYCAALIGQLI